MLHSLPVKKRGPGGILVSVACSGAATRDGARQPQVPHRDCPLLVALPCGVESVTPHERGVLSVARPEEPEMLFLTIPSRGARHISTGCASTKMLAEPNTPS